MSNFLPRRSVTPSPLSLSLSSHFLSSSITCSVRLISPLTIKITQSAQCFKTDKRSSFKIPRFPGFYKFLMFFHLLAVEGKKILDMRKYSMLSITFYIFGPHNERETSESRTRLYDHIQKNIDQTLTHQKRIINKPIKTSVD